MKTTKLFFMAALALMTAACSNDDNDLTTQQPQKAEGITITAQLAPKTNGATTRAVSDGGNKIVAEWDVNEHLAVLYEVGGTKKVADATITAVDGDDYSATIQFTVEEGTPDNTPCTLVYPYDAAKDDHTGVKNAATLLAAQDGTLNANLDVRVGEGTIQTTTPGLTVTTQPVAQFAIFKFTTKNSDASDYISVTSLTVSTGGQNYVITPASATSELYVALPPISSQAVTFTATDGSNLYTCYKDGVTFAAGNYYQSTLKNSNMVECGCGNLIGICYGSDEFTGQVLSAAQAIALAQAKAAETGSNCAVFYDYGDGYYEIRFAKNDGTTGSARANRNADAKGLNGYKGYYVSK